jgi:preprotein translocase subunit YajC
MLFSMLVLLAQVADGVGEEAKKVDPGAPPWFNLMPIVLVIAVVYFLLILPSQRKERRERESLMSALKKNDEVVTAGGIIGIVQSIKDNEVTLKIDENAKMRVLKGSITRIIPKDVPASPPTT